METMVSKRTNPYLSYPDLTKLLIEYSMTVQSMGLEPSLVELVKIRASQLNGCAVCLHMHTRDAVEMGESATRIFMLDAWRESPLFSARERAALAWTDALTRMDHRAEAEAYALVEAEFDAKEQTILNLMIGVINSFNRIGVGFALSHPGTAVAKQAA